MKKAKPTQPVKLNMFSKSLFRFNSLLNNKNGNQAEPVDHATNHSTNNTPYPKQEDFFT